MAKRGQRKPSAVEPRVVALPVKMIISGGQTGVDRAALDVAIELHIPHGGWCPRGRLAEDGQIPPQFQLKETDSRHYFVRTEMNVKEADGTLILFCKRLAGGSALTKRYAQKRRKPYLAVDISRDNLAEQVSRIGRWLVDRKIQILNVAGPRESSAAGIGAKARQILEQLLRRAPRKRAAKGTKKIRATP